MSSHAVLSQTGFSSSPAASTLSDNVITPIDSKPHLNFEQFPQEVLNRIVGYFLQNTGELESVYHFHPFWRMRLRQIAVLDMSREESKCIPLFVELDRVNVVSRHPLWLFRHSPTLIRTAFDQFFWLHALFVDARDLIRVVHLPNERIRLPTGTAHEFFVANKLRNIVVSFGKDGELRNKSAVRTYQIFCKMLPRMKFLFPALSTMRLTILFAGIRDLPTASYARDINATKQFSKLWFDFLYAFFKLAIPTKTVHQRTNPIPYSGHNFSLSNFEEILASSEFPVSLPPYDKNMMDSLYRAWKQYRFPNGFPEEVDGAEMSGGLGEMTGRADDEQVIELCSEDFEVKEDWEAGVER